MLTMTKRHEFDAAHRLLNHESKCANLHGHRYAVELELLLTGTLDKAGRIMDFGDVKRVFGGWLDSYLDHGTILNELDQLVNKDTRDWTVRQLSGNKLHVVDFEPSAENLAVYLLGKAGAMLDVPGSRRVVSCTLYETPTSKARATR
jgi:6-pyruvoyltetrahydropterin/6-carboxytetrahydropterin synthase